jgi:hypothetical protein
MPLSEFWKGSLTSGRQGTLTIRLKEDKSGHIKGTLIVNDSIFGPGWSALNGTLNRLHAELILGPFKTVAPISSSGGKVSFDLDATELLANGQWQTDIATGSFAVVAVDISRLRWWWSNVRLAGFFLLPRLYALFLVCLFYTCSGWASRTVWAAADTLTLSRSIPVSALYRTRRRHLRDSGIRACATWESERADSHWPTLLGA